MITFIDLSIILMSFLLMILDATFGGGYGTMLTPILLMVGFDPIEIVPAVLISQIVGDFLALFFHKRLKNVELTLRGKTFRVALTLSILSSIGTIISVIVSFNISHFYLDLYIGFLVLAIGSLVLVARNRNFRFSWLRLLLLGILAAFNKGLSGGGYGPLVSAGQILTGIDVKSAIGITALAEGITCIIAVMSYILLGRNIDYTLSIMLSFGAVLSAPLSAYFVKKIENRWIKLILGIVTAILGISTILKTLLLKP